MLSLLILIVLIGKEQIEYRKRKKKQDKEDKVFSEDEYLATNEERDKIYQKCLINLNEKLKVSGSPVHYESPYLYYDSAQIHSLIIATTASGKSRKHARQALMLMMKAKENIVVNDCKREFYNDFAPLFKKKGYNVKLLELRNIEYSDGWNPLEIILKAYEEGRVADADEYASDLVNGMVAPSNGEPIWQEGQKALIKALIMLVVDAPIPRKVKTLYTVSQILNILSNYQEKPDVSECMKLHLKLKEQYYSPLKRLIMMLPVDHCARIAFAPVMSAADRTEASFLATALSTLYVFNSQKVAECLNRNDIDLKELVTGDKPTVLFVVNPDEKTTYDAIVRILYQQIYTVACQEANRLVPASLPRRLNMVLDEFGNLPALPKFESMISVSRSRNIIYYLYIQDFAQMDQLYGKDVGKVIRANCNLWLFMASSDLETCNLIESKMGYYHVKRNQVGHSYNENHHYQGSSENVNYEKIPLISANDLMSYDNQDGKRCIVLRTYSHPLIGNLPDFSSYSWSEGLKTPKLKKKAGTLEKICYPHYYLGSIFLEDIKCYFSFYYWSFTDMQEELDDFFIVVGRRIANSNTRDGIASFKKYLKSPSFFKDVQRLVYEAEDCLWD